MATATPHRTPSSVTPANATIASRNSERRQRYSRRAPAMSMNPRTLNTLIEAFELEYPLRVRPGGERPNPGRRRLG